MRFLSPVFQTLSVIFALLLVSFIGPDVESRFRPVYSRFQIDQLYPYLGSVRVRFRYTKLRNCDPLGYAFFKGDPGMLLQVKSLDGVPPPKPVGNQISQLYEISGLTTDEFRTIVTGVITNHCHSLWNTRTAIYP